jgi:hypothetical protein
MKTQTVSPPTFCCSCFDCAERIAEGPFASYNPDWSNVRMRFVIAILVIVQLLLRGAAVPHCHAHDGRTQSADHANRPHVHVPGHSHSHAGDRHHSNQRHSHGHDESRREGHLPATPLPIDPGSVPLEHDQDTVYLVGETPTATVGRIQVPAPTDACWFSTNIDGGNQLRLPCLVPYRSAGPPGSRASTLQNLLPHLLRI